MVKSKRGGRVTTPMLVVWGIGMLLLGLGLGLLASSQGCGGGERSSRRSPSQEVPKREAQPKHVPKTAQESHKGAEAPKSEGREKDDKDPVKKPAKEPDPPQPRKEPRDAGHEPKEKLPKMALVIDDLGYAAPELVTRLCAQEIPFSVAVLPFQEYSRESAEIAHRRGKEVMLHLPMEPLGYPGPGKDPGPGAVMHDLSEDEIRLRVRKALEAVPYSRGVNNHMGSRITPSRTLMRWVLEEVKRRRQFFVDSRTEKDSVAFDVAEELGIPAVQRRVFLDDDKSFDEMTKQWERAVALAQKEGHVVIIGHIYPETIEALEKLIPRSKGEVEFVKAGTLTR